MLNSFAKTQSKHHTDAVQMQKHTKLLQTGEGKWADHITEPDKGKDFNRGKSTIERLMKRDQTKEEKPKRSGTKEGPTGRL